MTRLMNGKVKPSRNAVGGLRDGGAIVPDGILSPLPVGSLEAAEAIQRVKQMLTSGHWTQTHHRKPSKPAPPPKRTSHAAIVRLTPDVIALHRQGVPQRQIARQLGIAQSSVGRIVREAA